MDNNQGLPWRIVKWLNILYSGSKSPCANRTCNIDELTGKNHSANANAVDPQSVALRPVQMKIGQNTVSGVFHLKSKTATTIKVAVMVTTVTMVTTTMASAAMWLMAKMPTSMNLLGSCRLIELMG